MRREQKPWTGVEVIDLDAPPETFIDRIEREVCEKVNNVNCQDILAYRESLKSSGESKYIRNKIVVKFGRFASKYDNSFMEAIAEGYRRLFFPISAEEDCYQNPYDNDDFVFFWHLAKLLEEEYGITGYLIGLAFPLVTITKSVMVDFKTTLSEIIYNWYDEVIDEPYEISNNLINMLLNCKAEKVLWAILENSSR